MSRMGVKGSYATELASAVRDRRMALGMASPRDLAELAGLGVALVRMIEGSQRASYSEGTLLALDRALGWTLGSSARLFTTGVGPSVPDEVTGVGDDGPMILDIPTEAVADLTPAELVEVKAAATAAYLSRAREVRSARGVSRGTETAREG